MIKRKWKQRGAFGLAIIMAIGCMQFPVRAEESNIIEKGSDLTLPSVSAGDSVRFCADYEQIIDENGKVYTPLEDKTVKGFFETTSGTDQTVTKGEEITYTVRGQYEADENANAKPAVIPELQEWHGKTGTFVISSGSKLIISDEKLRGAAEEFAQDYLEITGLKLKEIKKGSKEDAKMCDFYFSLTEEEKGLGKEGYTIDIDAAVSVEAEDAVGAYWATRTILQILKMNGSMPKGIIRDYPKYEVRAFMLDVGRKAISMDSVKQCAKNMSWYKLNSLQLHLSDNLIWTRDYATEEEAIEQAYAAFRLESDNVGPTTGKSATSEDLYYTKDELRSFIQESRTMGIDVVPEFDMPAHALPFTRAFPEYMTLGGTNGPKGYLIEEIDLSKKEATNWAKSIWQEYMDGDNPVFDKDTTIHIGTDEFHGPNANENFRSFSDKMIEFVQDSGRNVRMWGSLTNKPGNTPVRSEGVQLNIWESTYANPQVMHQMGFDLINTLNTEGLYIVPSGTGNRGTSYSDYLNPSHLYNNFRPNKFGNYIVPAGDDQMLGGCYALWHDYIDTRANGISEYDTFDRFFEPLPYMSAKLWGEPQTDYASFTKTVSKTGTAPGTTIYGDIDYLTSTVASYTFEEAVQKDSSINQFDLQNPVNAGLTVSSPKALKLNGGASYVDTPKQMNLIGDSAVLKMRVKMDGDAAGEQILCESKEKYGSDDTYGTYAFKAVQKRTGKVGFSREGYDYSFDYELPKGEWVDLEFHSGQKETALYVNGEFVDNDPEIYYFNHPDVELTSKISQNGLSKVCTMLVPFGRIGSKTKSFKGEIDYVTVTGKNRSGFEYGSIPHSEMTPAACSVAPATATEGPVNFALDDNANTYWHTNWSTDKQITDNHYHWFKVTLDDPKTICKLTYLPRQDSENGRILKYGIDVEKVNEDGSLTTETIVSEDTWANTTDMKTAEFDPVTVKSVTLKILGSIVKSDGTHATIAELNLYEPFDAKAALQEAVEHCESDAYQKDSYSDQSWKALQEAKEKACIVLNSENSAKEDYLSAYYDLQTAMDFLTELTFMSDTEKTRYNLSCAIVEAEEALKELEGTKIFDSLQAAIAEAKEALENESGSGQTDLSEILSNLKDTGDLDKIVEATKQELNAVISEAKKNLANANGFTIASVNELRAAVAAAENILAKADVSVKELEEAIKKLGAVTLKKDTAKTEAGLKDNDPFEADGMKYQVVSASALTARLVKGKDAARLTVNTASFGGKTYKVVEIGDKAFNGCRKKLKKVTIGANVTTIGKNAFKGCKKLANVIIQNNSKLSKVGGGAFKKTSSKIKVKLPKNLKKNKKLKNQLKKAGIKKGL